MKLSLKELNEICQKPHYKEVGNWMVRKIERPLALYFTWAFLHTPLSANHITLISIGCGLVGGLFFTCPASSSLLIGVILFHAWYLLDHVDGQVARYRNQSSLSGVYLDYLSHYIVHAAFFFGIGFQAFFLSDAPLFLLLAVLAGAGSMLLGIFYDARYKAFFAQLEKNKKAEWIGYREPLEKLENVKGKKQVMNTQERIFSLLYKSCEIHVALNIVSLVAVFNLFWQNFLFMPWSYWLTLYYGIVFPLLFILRTYRHISQKKIEADFDSFFKTT